MSYLSPRSLNVPDGHFLDFIFSVSKFYALYNGENHFQMRELLAELHVFEYGGTTYGTLKNLTNLALNVEDFSVKTFHCYHEPFKFSALIGSLFKIQLSMQAIFKT